LTEESSEDGASRQPAIRRVHILFSPCVPTLIPVPLIHSAARAKANSWQTNDKI